MMTIIERDNKRTIVLFCNCCIVAMTGIFYCARVGFAGGYGAELLKSAALALALVNLPLAASQRLAKIFPRPLWPLSDEFLTLALFSLLVAIGSLHTPGAGFVFALAAIAAAAAVAHAAAWFRSGTWKGALLFIAMSLAVGAWLAGVNGNPLAVEELLIGKYNTDNLFHTSIANMIRTYNLPSTGLDGLPYLAYHWGSHWAFVALAGILNMDLLTFYQVGYPIVVVPLLFYASLNLPAALMSCLGGRFSKVEIRKSAPFWLLFLVAFVGVLPDDASKALRLGFHSNILSQSYGLSLTLCFLMFALLVRSREELLCERPTASQGALLAVAAAVTVAIGLTKISTLFLMLLALFYLVFRLGLYRNPWYRLFLVLLPAATLFIYPLIQPRSLASRLHPLHWFSFIPPTFLPFFPLVYFMFSTAYLLFVLHRNEVRSVRQLVELYRKGESLDAEIVLLVCVAGILPALLLNVPGNSAGFFANVQIWVSLVFLQARSGEISCTARRYWERLKSPATLLSVKLAALLATATAAASLAVNLCHPLDRMAMGNIAARRVLAEGFSQSSAGVLLDRLRELARTPAEQKSKTAICIPKSCRTFWTLLPGCQVQAVPFIVPAVTGMAMVDGLPEPDPACPRDGTYGYRSYPPRPGNGPDGSAEGLLSYARSKGFASLIVIDDAENIGKYRCGDPSLRLIGIGGDGRRPPHPGSCSD